MRSILYKKNRFFLCGAPHKMQEFRTSGSMGASGEKSPEAARLLKADSIPTGSPAPIPIVTTLNNVSANTLCPSAELVRPPAGGLIQMNMSAIHPAIVKALSNLPQVTADR